MRFKFTSELPALDPKPALIERWYDRSTRCWVVITTNAAGDQLGDATYVHSKREALLDAGWRQRDIDSWTPEA